MKVKNPQIYGCYDWSSATPGFLIILVDQSGSMMKPYCDGDSCAEFSAKVINRVIGKIIGKNFNKDKPKNRCFISVIGYGYEVKELCSGFLEDLYNNPIRVENHTQKIPDGNGGLLDVTVRLPIWVEPESIQGTTNMKGAFEQARSLVKKWMLDFPHNPAPVIINFTSNDCIPADQLDAVVDIAEELIALPYTFQKVRLLNIGIGCESKQTILPSMIEDISNPHDRVLWDISSDVDNDTKFIYNEIGLTSKESPKLLIINGTLEDTCKMISELLGLHGF